MGKWLFMVLWLVLSASVSEACQLYHDVIQDVKGNAIVGASVTIKVAGTSTLQTIYSDPLCATSIPNPVTTDSTGTFEFWTNDVFVDLVPSKTGYTFATIANVPIFSPLGDNIVTVANYSTTDICATGTGAIDQIGSTAITLIINKPVTCTLDKTVPTNVRLRFEAGGQITISSGKTLTIAGGPSRIFSEAYNQLFAGSGSVVFSQGGTVYPQWFGAVGDGSTDDSAAFQKAHDALSADGGVIAVRGVATNYVINTTVAFTKPVRLLGEDWYTSEVRSSTASVVFFTSTAKLVVENMNFTALGACIDTCVFIKHLSSSSNHIGTYIRNNFFDGANKAYWSQRSNGFTIEGNRFATGSYGVYLENTTSSDEGDAFIRGNHFANSVTGIYLVSTSGIYIDHNKFNSAVTQAHIDLAFGANSIGDIFIVGNSIEGHTGTYGIRSTGSGNNTQLIINSNQFGAASATHISIGALTKNVVINGNILHSTTSANGLGVEILQNAHDVIVTGNHFFQILTAIDSHTDIKNEFLSGNQFAKDVTNFYLTGEDTIIGGHYGSVKELVFSEYVENTSNAAYVNSVEFKGACTADIDVEGTVQGAGSAHWYSKKMIDGTTVTDIIAAVSTGSAFDVQVTASGGYVVVGIKRNGATGTSVTMQVTVKLTGYCTDFINI